MHSPLRISRNSLFAFLPLALFVLGCGGDNIPRPKAQITEEMQSIDALYRTEGGVDVIAPANATEGGNAFVDHNTGELAWRVFECRNPQCPAGSPSDPHLFICPIPGYSVSEDGTVDHGNGGVEERGIVLPDRHRPTNFCPECANNRNFDTESDEEAQEYIEFLVPHVLPSSAKRLAELEQEMQAREDHLDLRQQGGFEE